MEFAIKWVGLKNTTLNEITQAKKDKLCISFLYVGASFKYVVVCVQLRKSRKQETRTGPVQLGQYV